MNLDIQTFLWDECIPEIKLSYDGHDFKKYIHLKELYREGEPHTEYASAVYFQVIAMLGLGKAKNRRPELYPGLPFG